MAETWGPWADKISAGERLARLRSLRACVTAGFGVSPPVVKALFLAESLDPDDLAAAAVAWQAFPARDLRKALGVYGKLYDPKITKVGVEA